MLAATPFFGTLYDVFTSAVPRPSTPTGLKYNEVSAAFWNATHDVLSGQGTGRCQPEEAGRQTQPDQARQAMVKPNGQPHRASAVLT